MGCRDWRPTPKSSEIHWVHWLSNPPAIGCHRQISGQKNGVDGSAEKMMSIEISQESIGIKHLEPCYRAVSIGDTKLDQLCSCVLKFWKVYVQHGIIIFVHVALHFGRVPSGHDCYIAIEHGPVGMVVLSRVVCKGLREG